MELETVFGVTIESATYYEVLIFLLIILLVACIFIIAKNSMIANQQASHEYQLLLFKSKNRGLTNFQYRIVLSMVSNLKLKKPSRIMDDPSLYEQSIGSFINYIISTKSEKPELLKKFFKDIVITYEKLYKDTRHRKPLTGIDSLGTGNMVYFYTKKKKIFLGKIVEINSRTVRMKLFRKPSRIPTNLYNRTVSAFLWRPGDAEYTFTSTIRDQDRHSITIDTPETLKRGKEVPLPFINVILSFRIDKAISKSVPIDLELKGTVIKLSENEIFIRTKEKLDCSFEYSIEFTVDDYVIHSQTKLTEDKTINETGVFYYKCSLLETTDAAHKVIRSYIYEHI
jgi:hypothetical protein